MHALRYIRLQEFLILVKPIFRSKTDSLKKIIIVE
jgi:hypothetical protein